MIGMVCVRILLQLAVGGYLIAGILLTPPTSAQEHNSGDQPKSPQSSETKEQAAPKPPPGSPDGEQPVKTDWSNSPCDQRQNHDEADLCEQRRLSKDTEDTIQGRPTTHPSVFSIIGVSGLRDGWFMASISKYHRSSHSGHPIPPHSLHSRCHTFICFAL
jgi:hypothetical protein